MVFFNDPFYVISVLEPTTTSIVFHDLRNSLFIAAAMVFWFRQNIKASTSIDSRQNNNFQNKLRVTKKYGYLGWGFVWCVSAFTVLMM